MPAIFWSTPRGWLASSALRASSACRPRRPSLPASASSRISPIGDSLSLQRWTGRASLKLSGLIPEDHIEGKPEIKNVASAVNGKLSRETGLNPLAELVAEPSGELEIVVIL